MAMSSGPPMMIRRETEEERGFRKGLKYAREKKRVVDTRGKRDDMHRKLAYLYSQKTPEAAYIKQALDYWLSLATFAKKGNWQSQGTRDLYKFAKLKMVHVLRSLDAMCPTADVISQTDSTGYGTFVDDESFDGTDADSEADTF